MSRTVAAAAAAREDNDLVTSCQPVARPCLHDAVNQSGVARKVLACEICGGDEPLLSKKMAGGPTGRPFDLDDLDRLPREVLIDWLKRMCVASGLTPPRELELHEISERILNQADAIVTLIRLARVSTRQVKAGLR